MIKILTEETINKIAAGEVVERPASVVKELIENSLDARATSISVEIKTSGKNLIRVTDNGIGMGKQDALLSLSRHATSKINTAEDLENIDTLGFRGEALPSIKGVSRLMLVTRAVKEPAATKISASGGKILEVKETGAPLGTMLEVKNLFFNTPARRKFLKSNTTELTHIINVFSNYALVYTNCGFKLSHNNECITEVFTKDTLLDRIRVLYGNETADNVILLEFEKEDIKVSGYISKPSLTRPNRSSQFIFVNGRPITSRAINYAIYEGYNTLVPRGRFPVVFLFIEVLKNSLDVNVHPTKREVRFGNGRLIQEVVASGISKALQKAEFVPVVSFGSTVDEPVGVPTKFWNAGETSITREFQKELSIVQEKDNFYAVQMNNSYIVSETQDGFEIIDQHAAHERLLYEKIKEGLQKKQSISQRLLIPLTIELDPAEEKALRDKVPFLQELGFNIEDFGRHSVIIDMIPSTLNKIDITVFIKDMLSELKEIGHMHLNDNMRDAIIKITACRAAVKQGDKLDLIEIQKLLKEWKRLPRHYTCPHGRPAVIKMTKEELDKQFHRT